MKFAKIILFSLGLSLRSRCGKYLNG